MSHGLFSSAGISSRIGVAPGGGGAGGPGGGASSLRDGK